MPKRTDAGLHPRFAYASLSSSQIEARTTRLMMRRSVNSRMCSIVRSVICWIASLWLKPASIRHAYHSRVAVSSIGYLVDSSKTSWITRVCVLMFVSSCVCVRPLAGALVLKPARLQSRRTTGRRPRCSQQAAFRRRSLPSRPLRRRPCRVRPSRRPLPRSLRANRERPAALRASCGTPCATGQRPRRVRRRRALPRPSKSAEVRRLLGCLRRVGVFVCSCSCPRVVWPPRVVLGSSPSTGRSVPQDDKQRKRSATSCTRRATNDRSTDREKTRPRAQSRANTRRERNARAQSRACTCTRSRIRIPVRTPAKARGTRVS